jgi:hypothetical protein
MADGDNKYCFVTRLGTYKTITGSTRDDAEAKGNQSLAFGPVEFCHDGACSVEDASILDLPNAPAKTPKGLAATDFGIFAH